MTENPLTLTDLTELFTEELDPLVDQALGTALWSTPDPNTEIDDYLNARFTIEDVPAHARADMTARLLLFITENAELIAAARATGYAEDLTQIAHDYVLTCNREGAGFWDRGLGEIGEELTEATEAHGPWELFVTETGILELERPSPILSEGDPS